MAEIGKQIIDNIFGGHALYPELPNKGEFTDSYNIDIDPHGIISPANALRYFENATTSDISLAGFPLWIKAEPKASNFYIYDSVGSVYAVLASIGSYYSQIGDLNDGGDAKGCGMEYYDNYMYFARNTTIARYGPLNGTPTFTDDYWVTTLGLTALDNTYSYYPTTFTPSGSIPGHVMHRGKNGSLYIADVVGGQGVLHRITTTKTTVEGDTNNGSAYNVIDFPYGYYPSAIEGLDDDIVVALFSDLNVASGRAKIAFWDPTNPTTYTKIIDFEFPDPIITAMKNSNGVLYVFSSFTITPTAGSAVTYTRISRYIGGNSFEQIGLSVSNPPLAGAVDGVMNRVIFAGDTSFGGGVMAIGTKKSPISNSIFCIRGSTSTSNSVSDTAITALAAPGADYTDLISGFTCDNGHFLDGTTYNNAGISTYSQSYFSGPVHRVGKKFKITKVTIPILHYFNGTYPDVKISFCLDRELTYDYDGINIVGTINDTNYPFNNAAGVQRIVIRPTNLVGNNNFFMVIKFNNAVVSSYDTLAMITFPIEIEYETIDD